MKHVELGSTGMSITRVGMGAFAMGNDWAGSWGGQSDDDSIAAIRHGVERGVNWIDTAPAYGLGQAEDVIRRALEELPAAGRPYVFTKCGLFWDEADRLAPLQRKGDRESLVRGVENSLERLGVETIDLLQMHWPPRDDTPIEEYWSTMLELKASGKARAIGLSNHDAETLARAEAVGHVDTLQPPFSAIDRRAAAADLPWCAAHGVGVIVYSPMQSGLLTGRFSQERAAALAENDWRSRDAEFQQPRLAANLALAESLKPIAEKHGVPAAAVTIAWTLSWPGVTGAIVGARTPEQLDGWFAATELELDSDDLAVIGDAIEATGAGSGPSRA